MKVRDRELETLSQNSLDCKCSVDGGDDGRYSATRNLPFLLQPQGHVVNHLCLSLHSMLSSFTVKRKFVRSTKPNGIEK
jgi:hypothetical protein